MELNLYIRAIYIVKICTHIIGMLENEFMYLYKVFRLRDFYTSYNDHKDVYKSIG